MKERGTENIWKRTLDTDHKCRYPAKRKTHPNTSKYRILKLALWVACVLWSVEGKPLRRPDLLKPMETGKSALHVTTEHRRTSRAILLVHFYGVYECILNVRLLYCRIHDFSPAVRPSVEAKWTPAGMMRRMRRIRSWWLRWLCLEASGRTLFCLGRGFKEGLAICGQTWVIPSTWVILTPVIAARSTSLQCRHTIRGPP